MMAELSDQLEELPLGGRARNSPQRGGVFTIGQLTEKTEDELLDMSMLGVGQLAEIVAVLSEAGLSLAGNHRRPKRVLAPALRDPVKLTDKQYREVVAYCSGVVDVDATGGGDRRDDPSSVMAVLLRHLRNMLIDPVGAQSLKHEAR